MSHIKNRKQKIRDKKQEGVSLLFIVLISAVILAIGLGINALLIKEIKMMSNIDYSVTAFYAADSGIEAALYDLYQNQPPENPCHSDISDSVNLGVNAYYDTSAKCCNPDFDKCSFGGVGEDVCPLGLGFIDSDCETRNYCLESAGSYKEIKRAIRIKY